MALEAGVHSLRDGTAGQEHHKADWPHIIYSQEAEKEYAGKGCESKKPESSEMMNFFPKRHPYKRFHNFPKQQP